MCIKTGEQCYMYINYSTKHIKNMFAWFYATVEMCKFTHLNQAFNEAFIQFFPNLFLERRNTIYITVINIILFGIVVHIKMMFLMCLILMLCEWYSTIFIRSKSKGEIYIFLQLWHLNNIQPVIRTWILILFGMFFYVCY